MTEKIKTMYINLRNVSMFYSYLNFAIFLVYFIIGFFFDGFVKQTTKFIIISALMAIWNILSVITIYMVDNRI
ncbi:hypothetical protein DRN73_07490 [Candidatus Pacearchaeota archaeon]|nr:MAG: hypothetical protein DRN73_07490 [Candidatus Pacearchaeota archaeon]